MSPDLPLVNLPTRARELRAQAAAVVETARARAAEIQEQAQLEAEKLLQAAEVLERLASGEDISSLRTSAQERDKVRTMNLAHKLALSEAKAESRLSKVIQEAGYTLRLFAALPAVDVPESTLRSGHSGARPIYEDECLRVQHALGKDSDGNWRFPATTSNWPKMRPRKKRTNRAQ